MAACRNASTMPVRSLSVKPTAKVRPSLYFTGRYTDAEAPNGPLPAGIETCTL